MYQKQTTAGLPLIIKLLACLGLLLAFFAISMPQGVFADGSNVLNCDQNSNPKTIQADCHSGNKTPYACGSKDSLVHTAINLGCKGTDCLSGNTSNEKFCQSSHSAILDATFGIIRFLSNGVGLIIVASLIVGGIQYSASGGSPEARSKALKRLMSIVTALLIYIFAYAILNYVLPQGFLS